MRKAIKTCGLAILLLFTILGDYHRKNSEPPAKEIQPIVKQAEEVIYVAKEEVIEEINLLRKKHNLKPLRVNPLLEKSALLKAKDMASKDYFDHDLPDGRKTWVFFKEAGYRYYKAGENLAKSPFWDASDIVSAWLVSKKHKEVMLTPEYKEVGVATFNEFTVAHFGVRHNSRD